MSKVTDRASQVIVLEIDLSSGKVEKRDLGMEMREKYIGSRGVNARLLYDNVGPETDSYSPGNLVLFGTGAMAGAGLPFTTRMNTLTKSNYCVYAKSDIGGYFAPELRKAGYDHIVVKGKVEKPVYVWIDNDKVEIRSAAHLWGKGTQETFRLIRGEFGDDVQIAAIGQAGENLVRYADVIIAPERGGGSRGMGAAMGSKKLKAIAVRGSGSIEIANKKLALEKSQAFLKMFMERPHFKRRSTYGGSMCLSPMYQTSTAPIRNMTCSYDEEIFAVDENALAKYYTKMESGCPGCTLTHWPNWEIKEGPYAGEKGWGMEGGVAVPFGPIVGTTYAPAVLMASKLCNDYGIDASESSTVIAAAIDWFQNGLLTREDVDGMELKWGDHTQVTGLIHKIARREGFGDVLAEGCVRAAEKVGKGAKEYISHSKGRTTGICDWRVLKGAYLNEMTSSPACEMMDGWPVIENAGKLLMGQLTPEYEAWLINRYGSLDVLDTLSYNKSRAVVFYQDLSMVCDLLGFCLYASEWVWQVYTIKDMAELHQAVTGIDMGEEDLVKAARRVRTLERAYWAREGFTRKDDYLEGRIATTPMANGEFEGHKMDPSEIDRMLDEYYQLRGYDLKTGMPTRETLLAYGLEDVVEDLEKRRKL